MNAALREGLRLRAIRAGWEPFRIRTHRRVPLNADALLWTSISLPGDASRPLGVILGTRYDPEPGIYICDDPRDPQALVAFFAALGKCLETAVADASPFLQIVVGDSHDVRHLVATSLRAGHVGPSNPWNTKIKTKSGKPFDPEQIRQARRFGYILAQTAIVRNALTYQGALVTLTSELAEHVVTAISDSERENLAIQLAYANPGVEYWTRREMATAAMQQPCDHRLLGSFDDSITASLEAVKNAGEGDSGPKIAYRDEVLGLLQPLRALHEQAYDHIASFEPGGDGANYIQQGEKFSIEKFRLRLGVVKLEESYNHKTTGQKMLPNPNAFLVGRQGTKHQIELFIRQERFHELDEYEMLRKDPIARASGILEGKVVRGTVRNLETDDKHTLLEIVTKQEVAEFEERDDIQILDWNKQHDLRADSSVVDGTIESLMIDGDAVVYVLRVRRAIRLQRGTVLELAEKPFGGSTIFDITEKRMRTPMWTHSEETTPVLVPTHTTSENRVAELFGKL